METINQNVFELVVKKYHIINYMRHNIISLAIQLTRSKLQIKLLKAKNEASLQAKKQTDFENTFDVPYTKGGPLIKASNLMTIVSESNFKHGTDKYILKTKPIVEDSVKNARKTKLHKIIKTATESRASFCHMNIARLRRKTYSKISCKKCNKLFTRSSSYAAHSNCYHGDQDESDSQNVQWKHHFPLIGFGYSMRKKVLDIKRNSEKETFGSHIDKSAAIQEKLQTQLDSTEMYQNEQLRQQYLY